jgi:gliding motility-associated-like protein
MAYTMPQYICRGDTLPITIGNATYFSWESMNDISTGTYGNEFLLHPDDDAEFILTGYYADCLRTDTIDLMVRDLPIISLDVPDAACYGDPVLELNGGLPNDPPGIYTVNGQIATIFDTGQTPGLIYEIEYTYTDTFLCTNSVIEQIMLHSLPVVEMPALPDMCEDESPLILNSGSPAGGFYTYLGDTVQTFDPAIGMGNYTLAYHFTDNNGCYSMDSTGLTIHPLPMPEMSFDTACLNTGLIIDNLTTIAQGYIASVIWDFGVGGSDENFEPEPVIFPVQGNYAFSLTAVSDAGCSATIDSTAEVHAAPQPLFTPDVACQHTLQVFVDQSTIAADSLQQWIWNTEGQSITSASGLEYAFSSYGEIPVVLTVVSNFGCSDSIIIPVHVRPAPVVDVIYDDGCIGTESLFEAEVTIPYGGVVSHIWSFGDDHPDESGTSADNNYAAEGTYEVTFTASSNMGCETILRDSITIYPTPEPDFSVDLDHLCAGVPIQLIDLSSVDSPSSISAWTWYIEGNQMSNQQNPVTTLYQPGAFDIMLRVTSDHGCSSDTTIDNGVVIYPSPQAGFIAEHSAEMSDPVINIVDDSSEDVTYWYYDFGDDSGDTFEDGFHEYTTHGEYLITQYVSNTFGCRDTAYKSVEILPELLVHIPNAFTPDANGHNEVFKPVIYGFDVTYYSLKIFNRWGIQVFETNDPEEGWTGHFKDNVAEDGSYSWIMEIRNGKDVEIIRKLGKVILLR